MTGRVSKRRTSTRIRPGGAATLVLAVPARESSCSQASPPHSTNYPPGLWVAPMPEQADRVIGQLAKQVVEAPSRAEQRVALPPAGVAVVVQGPESFGGDVAKPRDRQPRPFGGEVIAPRRAKLDDVDRLDVPARARRAPREQPVAALACRTALESSRRGFRSARGDRTLEAGPIQRQSGTPVLLISYLRVRVL